MARLAIPQAGSPSDLYFRPRDRVCERRVRFRQGAGVEMVREDRRHCGEYPWLDWPYRRLGALPICTSDRETVSARDASASVKVPASKWYGKTVDIAVNIHGSTGHTAGWSPFVAVAVVQALPTPQGLVATDAPDAVHLEWHAGAPEFRVSRKLEDEANWTQIGTSTRPSYTDSTIEYGKTYQYQVISVEKTGSTYAQSELSDTATIKPKDMFPPAVPAGLSAIPGSR